jgi:hypothetical protein
VPVLIATGEAEIERMLKASLDQSPWEKVGHSGTCLLPSYGEKHKIGGSRSWLTWPKRKNLSPK